MFGPDSAFLLLAALMIWAPRLKWKWVRILVRVAGVALALWVLLIVGLGIGLTSGVVSSPPQTFASPGNTHQAILLYTGAGAVGGDSATVQITNAGCCKHNRVFWADDVFPGDVSVHWTGENSLQIEYHQYHKGSFLDCAGRVAGVTVTCTPHDAKP